MAFPLQLIAEMVADGVPGVKEVSHEKREKENASNKVYCYIVLKFVFSLKYT